MKKTILLALLVLMGVGLVNAQTRVTGKVTSADDGSPLPFVTVSVKDFTTVATTGNDGSYIIDVPAGGEMLIFSFVGMVSQEVGIGGRAMIDITLQNDDAVLDDAIIIAYGTTKRGGFTGAAVSIDSKAIEMRPVSTVTSVLEGATGIQTLSASGQPGSSPSIRIRGYGSLNASNTPLYVLDGFPFDGGIADINPSDIENITVLKDASASSLYGARAANGVILITTKKGRKGSLVVNFRTTHGFSNRGIKEYDRIGPYDYVPLMWENMYNGLVTGGTAPATAAATASSSIMGSSGLGYNAFNVPNGDVMLTDGKLNPNARITYGDFNWEDEVFRTGYRGEYALNASGGTELVTYMFSANHLKESGYTKNSDMKRTNVRAAVDVNPVKWFKAGTNVSAMVSETNNIPTGSASYNNPFYFTRMMAPGIYPVYKHNADGSYVLDSNGNREYEWTGRVFAPGRHIVAENAWNTELYERNTLGGRVYADFYFLEGLKFTVNAGYDQRNTYNTTTDNPTVGDGATDGRSYRSYYTTKTWNFNQLLNYEKSFGLHNIQLLAGHESYEYIYNAFYGRRTGVILEGNTELINYSTVASLSSYTNTETVEGYMFRGSYDYNNKYYLSASYRRDGSSRFHKDARWGDFWSVGATWRMDRENFMKGIHWVDMLKLRSSYGQTGNSGMLDADGYSSYYPWLNLFDIQRNGNTPGFIMSTLAGNDKLTWEKNSTFSIAAEFSLFNRRLNGTIEFYHRISDNLLFNVPMTLSSGMKQQPQNIGTMYNQGFEIELSGDILRAKDFTWNMGINANTIKNEMTKMPPTQEEIISGTKKYSKGHSIYDFWLRTYVGVNPTNGYAMYILNEDTNYGTSFYDYNGQLVTENPNYAKYDYNDSAIPDLYGSIRSTFTYKDISLSAMFMYSLGGKVYDNTYFGLMTVSNYGDAKHPDILNRWQNPGDITDVPKMDANMSTNVNVASSRWLTNASYLSLKSISLSYTLPRAFVEKLTLSNVQVFASAENLFLITHRKGLNLSYSYNGTQSNVYSPARVITFGLNLSF